MENKDPHDEDEVPEWLAHLSPSQRDRLTDLLDRYLQSLEQGEPLNLADLWRDEPELEGPLRNYLQQLDLLHGAAAEIRTEAFAVGGATGVDIEGEHQRLGDFTLIREIGRGGMGLVYEAIQESLERRVALKLLPMAAMFSPTQVARFRNEAQAAAQLQHPHIIPVYAIGAEKGIHYFAMPLIDGKSLDEVIDEERRVAENHSMTPSVATRWLLKQKGNAGGILMAKVRLAIQAAEALHAAHEVGIVHRDIKPSNLMLENEGKLYIADFGLARVANDRALTKTGELIGTMRYMSPEQARGNPSLIDHRTDIYSLGASLYEFLTGHAAVEGEEGAGLLQAIQQPIIPLRKWLPEAPSDLGTVIQMAMAKAKEDRYLTAKAFAEDLRRVIEGRPTLAKPPTLLQRIGSWEARHQRLVATTLVLGSFGLLISMILAGVFAWMQQVSRGNYLRAEQHFKEARDIVELFGTKFTDQLSGIAGAEPVRQAMLRESLKYHLAFAEEASNDPLLQQDVATTLFRIGTLTRELDSASEALPYFRSASQKFAGLSKSGARTQDWFQAWAHNESSLGLTLGEVGQLEEGLALLKQLARELGKPGFSNEPTAPFELARALNNAGLLSWRAGQTKEAQALLEEAWRTLERVADDAQVVSKVERLQLASAIHENIAVTYQNSAPQRAAELYRTALTYQRERQLLLDYESPSPAMARTLSNIGAAERQAKRWQSASQYYEEAIAAQRQLLSASPQLASLRRDLGLSLNNQGLVLIDLSQWQLAEERLREAMEILKGLLEEHPDDLELRSGLSALYNNLGLLGERKGDDVLAVDWYRKGIEEQRHVLELAPSVGRYRELLGTEYANFSRLQRRAKQWDVAFDMATSWRELWRENPEKLLAVAKEMAEIAVEAVRQEGDSQAVRRYKEQLIETLKQAKSAGLKLNQDIMNSAPFDQAISAPSKQALLTP